MYSVKTSGKGYYRFFEPKYYGAVRARLKQESELRRAIEHDQFAMYYQACVDISTGTTSRRWYAGRIRPGVCWSRPSHRMAATNATATDRRSTFDAPQMPASTPKRAHWLAVKIAGIPESGQLHRNASGAKTF